MRWKLGLKRWLVWLMISGVCMLGAGALFLSGGDGTSPESQGGELLAKIAALESRLLVLENSKSGSEGVMAGIEKDRSRITQLEDTLKLQAMRIDLLEKKIDTLSKREDNKKTAKKHSSPSRTAVTVGPVFHTVRQGDTLYRISKTYRLTTNELVRINKLNNKSRIYAGQRLRVSP